MMEHTRVRPYSVFWISFVSMVVVGVFVIQSGCYREYDRGASAYGASLTVVISGIEVLDEVAYSVGEDHYVLRPTNPQNRLLVAKVVVANNRSARSTMFVDERAAYFSDDKRNNFLLVDPYGSREVVSASSESENHYIPFLWGNIDLKENYQVEGWMVFESPPEPELTSFYWEQSDPIRVPLK